MLPKSLYYLSTFNSVFLQNTLYYNDKFDKNSVIFVMYFRVLIQSFFR